MKRSLFRVKTRVDRHDFGAEVVEDFVIHWVATNRNKPAMPYAEGIADWSSSAFAAGEKNTIAAVSALDQFLSPQDADSLSKILMTNFGWTTDLEEVELPLQSGQRPVASSKRVIELPPEAIRGVPGQERGIVGFVHANESAKSAKHAPKAQHAPPVKTPEPTSRLGVGVGVSIRVPQSGEPIPDPTEEAVTGSQFDSTLSSKPSEESQVSSSSIQPSSTISSHKGANCEACLRATDESTSQVVELHTLCLVCVQADQKMALVIARKRHRKHLQALLDALD